MAPRRAAVTPDRVVHPFPPEVGAGDVEGSDALLDALNEIGRGMNRMADVGEALVTAVAPAADTVHGFGARLDALCKWLGGKWPWITAFSATVLFQTVSRAPEEAPKLIEALAGLLKAVT